MQPQTEAYLHACQHECFMDKFLLLLYPLLPPPQSIPDKSVPYCSLTEEEEHTHYVLAALSHMTGPIKCDTAKKPLFTRDE